MKLIERCAGTGSLIPREGSVRQVRYDFDRYQGMAEGSGLPVPGFHRIEGRVDLDGVDPGGVEAVRDLIGRPLTLQLEDGRAMAVTLADDEGRIVSEGHGFQKCLCC